MLNNKAVEFSPEIYGHFSIFLLLFLLLRLSNTLVLSIKKGGGNYVNLVE